ncbi:MAG: hypothetical protein O3A56_07645 [Proteobacteria bacterium]|jgi:hypothetical protein|nr:hypothetical protein [Pseudomonadota bacterium]MDA0862660.1 hypothetical protein [Pseudomonadota bacterium]MDA1031311.1 hypothetical protein [Pseudomonadota bacterium]
MPLYALATYVLISIFSNGIAPNAHAQFNTALTDKTYHEPWELHNKVFEQLSTSQLRILQESSTAKVDRVLIYLDTDAKYFEKQVIEAINHMFGLPNFTEIAGDVSFNWSETLIRVDSNLKLIYAALGIQGEVNVLEAHRATQTLIDALAKKRPFERDVLNSLGRGVKNLTVDMANRWWISSEGLTKLVAKLKEPSPKTLE